MPDNVSTENTILIVGAGSMAQAYAKVLQFLQQDMQVIGRGTASARSFVEATGITPVTGGLTAFIAMNGGKPFKKAIVTTGTEALKATTVELVEWGVQEILLEKPGGVSIEEVEELGKFCRNNKVEVYIAYNRRHYTSVLKLLELIEADGGVLSFNFEFTEWAHKIAPLLKAPMVKENWFFANSTHVVDLAFHLGGRPVRMSSYSAGKLDWHPVSIFAGSGITDRNALFSYSANWGSPGRWSIEVLTARHRYYLKPLEELKIQKIGSLAVEDVELDLTLDTRFKPGVYRQTLAFLENKPGQLVTMEEHLLHCGFYKQILNQVLYDNHNTD